MPIVTAWHTGGIRVFLLMAGRAIQSSHAFAIRTSYHVRKMPVTIVPLLRVVRRGVTVNAAREGEH
jgi:hypothetical protein